MHLENRIAAIVEILDRNKAEEIEAFNLDGSEYIAERVVLATSLNPKHTAALLDHLRSGLKPMGEQFIGVDESEGWIVIDLGDIIIHLMTPPYRQRYQIEAFLDEHFGDVP